MNSVPLSVTVKVTQRDKGIRVSPKNASGLPNFGHPLARRVHSAQDRPLGRGRGARSIPPKVGRLRSGGHEHEILRRDRDRSHAAAPFIVESIDGHAAWRWRETDVLHEGTGEQVHAARAQPRNQRFDERLVLIDGRAHHARHVRQVTEQVKEAVHVAPKFDRAVLGQRPHDGRPEEPELGREKSPRKEFDDAPPVQHRFGRQQNPRKAEAVTQAQAETRAMHDAAVAIENVRPVTVRLASIEREEFLRDGNRWIACGGDPLEQFEGAAKFLVDTEPGRL